MSTIAAGTTSTTALVSTGDTTGNLVLQTNGTTTAMTIDTSQNVGIGTSSPAAPLDVVCNSSSTGVSVRGRSSDNLSAIRLYSNDGATQYSVIRGASDEFRLNAFQNIPLTFYTNNAERMRIDSAGRVTMPYQPMFSAKKITGQNLSGGTTADITFTSALVNIGSHYNTSTSKFTAPIAGTYYFSIQTNIAPGTASYFSIIPLKNGSALGNVAAFTGSVSNGGYENVSISFILTLAAADYISCELQHNGNPTIDNAGVFCGFLIG